MPNSEFVDIRDNPITPGVYRKFKDGRSSSYYIFLSETNGVVGLNPNTYYWDVRKVSVRPKIYKEERITRSESKKFIPVDKPFQAINGLLGILLKSK